MVSIAKKDFIVGDWINGVSIIGATNLIEAIKGYLAHENILLSQNKHTANAFGIEVSDTVRDAVLSINNPVGQSEALADVDGVKFFRVHGNGI